MHDVCFQVLQARLPSWTEGQIHEFVELNASFVAEHLRDEASEWNVDGKPARFEIDHEQLPYIRACAQATQPILRRLRKVDPFKFEDVCKLILQKLGADAKTTQQTVDGGIDFFGSGLKIVQGTLGVPIACGALVIGQAKRYKDGNNIRETQVREFVGAAVLRKHQLSFDGRVGPLAPALFAFWTTSDFDPNAKRFARATGIWYMDGDTLANYVMHLGLEDEVLAMQESS